MAAILVAHSRRLSREGLCRFLAGCSGLAVVGETGDGVSAVRMAAQLRPQLALLEIGLPLLNGIDATAAIHRDAPDTRVIVILTRGCRPLAPQALTAGASGLLVTDDSLETLQVAVRRVLAGARYVATDLADAVFDGLSRGTEGSSLALSTRERQVLQLVAEGRSTSEVADSLHISPRTVETHRRRIMGKLNLHSLPHLTKYAIREGLTSVEA